MKACIKPFDASREYFLDEGCYINELSNSDQDPELSMAQARLEPGKSTRWHHLLGTTERYVMLSGTGRVEVGDLPPQEVGAGDVVIIPPEVRQRIHNIGSDDLVFLVACSPPFTADIYVDDEA